MQVKSMATVVVKTGPEVVEVLRQLPDGSSQVLAVFHLSPVTPADPNEWDEDHLADVMMDTRMHASEKATQWADFYRHRHGLPEMVEVESPPGGDCSPVYSVGVMQHASMYPAAMQDEAERS